MGRLKVFGLALLSLFVVGVMTAGAASAESTPLPNIHTALPGENYPINLGGKLASVSRLKNAGGGVLEGTELSVLIQAKELTSLGAITIVFLGVSRAGAPTEKCKSVLPSLEGIEKNGEVKIDGEYHLVYTGLSPANTLEVAALIEFGTQPLLITCNLGALEVENFGPSTSRINVPTPEAGKEGDSTSLQTATHCAVPATTGLQEIPYYYNDTLTEVATTLLANVSGTGKKNSCEEIEGTLLLTPETGSSATMFSVLF